MKHEKYLGMLFMIWVLSYFMMVNFSVTAAAEDLSNYAPELHTSGRGTTIFELRNLFMGKKELIEYTQNLTKLRYDDCEFIIKECERENIDPFMLLGIIRRESNFNPKAQGFAGERGLGQLMGSTAKIVAENLGYVYDPDMLFDSRYNLKLTIAQISYLIDLYGGDEHKALTAYNRGQQGLVNYMNMGDGKTIDSAVSDYSKTVLQYAKEYKDNFSKYN